MAIVDVTDESFAEEVEKEEEKTVLVDFWAPWCPPCRMIAPVLEEIDAEMSDKVKITKVNVDENPDLSKRFGVMSIPTLLLFKNGEVVNKMSGFMPKAQLVEWMNPHL